MKFNNKILEAVNRGIKLSLDNFDDEIPVALGISKVKSKDLTSDIIQKDLEEETKPILRNYTMRKYASYFDINCQMYTWFLFVSLKNFNDVFDYGIATLRAVRGKRYVEDNYVVGIYFIDGYLEVRLKLYPHGKNKFTTFNCYFSENGPINDYIEKADAYKKQINYLQEKDKMSTWNDFSITYTRKEALDRMKRWFKKYANLIIKQ